MKKSVATVAPAMEKPAKKRKLNTAFKDLIGGETISEKWTSLPSRKSVLAAYFGRVGGGKKRSTILKQLSIEIIEIWQKKCLDVATVSTVTRRLEKLLAEWEKVSKDL